MGEIDEQSLREQGTPVKFGKATFVDPHTIELAAREGGTQRVRARSFILCVGAVPSTPPIQGLEKVPYLTYETIFDVDVLPARLCVIGGGVIGCELAQSFARLGSNVTLVGSKLLPKEPPKVDQLLSEQMADDGVTIVRGRATAVVEVEAKVYALEVTTATGKETVTCDMLLVCSGRRPHTEHMRLDLAGVEVDPKTQLIKVSPQLQTTQENIYAAGDCCTLQQFTHYAGIMGIWAVRNLLFPGSTVPTHVVPRVTFTTPEVASVGMTEAEALEKLGSSVKVACVQNSHNERAICENDLRGFCEVYLDKSGQILGATLMCNRAGELLSELLVAIENKIPFQKLSWMDVVHPYPTYSFSLMMLANDVFRQSFDASVSGKISKWLVGGSGSVPSEQPVELVERGKLDKIFSEMRGYAPLLKDRQWMCRKYPQCLDAKDVVGWLVSSGLCGSRADAVKVGMQLQEQNFIAHVWGSQQVRFSDATLYFKYAAEAADKMVADSYDLVVIGAGVAGMSAAGAAGALGANVVCIEANRIGGDCTWSGCVPSKALIKASHTVHDAREAVEQFGLAAEHLRADMKRVKDRVWAAIHKVAELDVEALKDVGVPVRYAKATFVDPHTVELTNPKGEKEAIRGRSFILCLGASPSLPPIKGLESVPFKTYETIFDVEVLPKRLCVVGSGVIGCELAQSFARLGSQVTLVGKRLLAKEPLKVDQLLAEQMAEDGVTIVRGRATAVAQLGADELQLEVTISEQETKAVACDMLLVCSGRRPHTESMRLDLAGVELEEKTKLIKVNSKLQTSQKHIYAAGDCCTLQQFTHYAGLMGLWATRNLLLPGSGAPTQIVPRVTFTTPEVASVGMTEAEAREKLGDSVKIACIENSHNERAICENDLRGFTEVYLDQKGLILGATIMHNRAGEVLAELLLAMENKIPFQNLSWGYVVHPYPSYSFALMMLASEVLHEKFSKSLIGKAAKWYVSPK